VTDDARVLSAKITRAGLTALFSADRAGLQLKLAHIAIGTGQANNGYAPTGFETALRGEFQRVAVGGGEAVGETEILVQALFDGAPKGWINEVGIFDEDGVLFALWSEPNAPLAYKSPSVPLVVALTLAVSEIPAGSLTLMVGGPSVNITLAAPLAGIAAEIVRLQRRAVQTECERLDPTIVRFA
jgi:hypothetical protein